MVQPDRLKELINAMFLLQLWIGKYARYYSLSFLCTCKSKKHCMDRKDLLRSNCVVFLPDLASFSFRRLWRFNTHILCEDGEAFP